MRIRSSLLHDLAGLSAAMAVRAWMHTMSCKAAFYDPTVDPAHPRCLGQRLYLFWHEYLLLPLYYRGHCNLAMLLSRHQDAEILGRTARIMGFETIRGSTGRGGTAALREMLRKSREMNLTMVPDGPRGPRRVLAPGAVYLASKLQLPLVLMGLGCDRPWRASSWDRLALPRPFSRIRAVVSPPMLLPQQLDREGIEHYRRHVESMLNRLTSEAEAWAESGTPKIMETTVRVEAVARRERGRRGDGPASSVLAADAGAQAARNRASTVRAA